MAEEDFDLAGLADYLHMEQGQVSKLADRGALPGRKVAGRWRFSRAAVHHWLEERIGLSEDEDQLLRMEGALQRAARPGDDQPILLADLLAPAAVAVPLAARTRASVVSAMCELAAQAGTVWDAKKLAEAVDARERLSPTALDNGVAMLHPRRPMPTILAEPSLALGITQTGIPFGNHRGVTDIFFLICSTTDQVHLRVLARLGRLIGEASFLTALRQAPDANAARELVVERDRELT